MIILSIPIVVRSCRTYRFMTLRMQLVISIVLVMHAIDIFFCLFWRVSLFDNIPLCRGPSDKWETSFAPLRLTFSSKKLNELWLLFTISTISFMNFECNNQCMTNYVFTMNTWWRLWTMKYEHMMCIHLWYWCVWLEVAFLWNFQLNCEMCFYISVHMV